MNSDREKALAFFLTVIALNAIFAAFVKGPLNEELASMEARINGLKRLEASLPDKPVPLVRKGGLRDKKGIGLALTGILAAARAHGLEIHEAEYNRSAGDGGQDSHTLSFPVKGSYGQIKEFIFSLETMGRRIEVEDISLAGGGEALAARLGIHMPKAGGP